MSYSIGDLILLPFPFSDFQLTKVRPAVVISEQGDRFPDHFIVPLTSRTGLLQGGEFVLSGWKEAGLNVPTAVKRGCYLVSSDSISKRVGRLTEDDYTALKESVRFWLNL